jgi:hypothetical protein
MSIISAKDFEIHWTGAQAPAFFFSGELDEVGARLRPVFAGGGVKRRFFTHQPRTRAQELTLFGAKVWRDEPRGYDPLIAIVPR